MTGEIGLNDGSGIHSDRGQVGNLCLKRMGHCVQ